MTFVRLQVVPRKAPPVLSNAAPAGPGRAYSGDYRLEFPLFRRAAALLAFWK